MKIQIVSNGIQRLLRSKKSVSFSDESFRSSYTVRHWCSPIDCRSQEKKMKCADKVK